MSQMMPPSAPPAAAPTGGHGPFSDADIQQMMAATGYDYQKVCSDIDQSGATTKEEVYPQIYSGQGIMPAAPADGQMAAPGVVQGQPPPMPPGGPPPMPPPEAGEGEAPQSPPQEAAEGEGIDPRVAQAMHKQMAPTKYKRAVKES